jgi:hypothetical protein
LARSASHSAGFVDGIWQCGIGCCRDVFWVGFWRRSRALVAAPVDENGSGGDEDQQEEDAEREASDLRFGPL